ncbi:LOW QUALITY PROTEIN: SET domain-containing protein SmydA-8-like [Phymastichus coffea]|uniref:LOW QUALITY PROTEIN: SET domain-containing protein SmydA-8-like n=1 Tax=Phymastichus coffea TaxID=108790 RepID=UPI00273BFC8E|nr:LOW QUALITY PROTEIN: SET domain-containing protein SmydA-8-like [Phymastichus coffea]
MQSRLYYWPMRVLACLFGGDFDYKKLRHIRAQAPVTVQPSYSSERSLTKTQSYSIMSEKLAYEMQRNDQVGRYLIASRELQEGEEILTEQPFVVGPKASTYPICLGCYSPWPPTEDSQPLCSTCAWPVCSTECENHPHHKDYECEIFAKLGEKFDLESALSEEHLHGLPHYECITPLRLLLAAEKDAERWNSEVKGMEAHNKKRSQKDQWKTDHVNVVEYIRNRLKLERFSEEQIQTACGVLEVNCHEVRSDKGFVARALYPKVAMMNHSCVSNTVHSVCPAENYKIYLRTAVRVPLGGELFGNYTHALLPTMLRREHLLESKYFACVCHRCADPTELGSHISSLKCNKCDNGLVVPLDSLDADSQWKCTHCEFSTRGAAVNRVQKIIQGDMDQAEVYTLADGPDAIHVREQFIKKYHSALHPRHAFLIMTKYSLCQLYGRVEQYLLEDLPDIVLEHKVDMCRQLLQVLDIVEPGMSRSRGIILYELHAPLLFIARSQWTASTIDNAALKSKMIEAMAILKQAADILSLEPKGTPEAEIAEGAKQAMAQLQTSIDDL